MPRELQESNTALLTELDTEAAASLEVMAKAMQHALLAAQSCTKRWVAYSLTTGELGLTDDDYLQLCDRLVAKLGDEYYLRVGIIGPLKN